MKEVFESNANPALVNNTMTKDKADNVLNSSEELCTGFQKVATSADMQSQVEEKLHANDSSSSETKSTKQDEKCNRKGAKMADNIFGDESNFIGDIVDFEGMYSRGRQPIPFLSPQGMKIWLKSSIENDRIIGKTERVEMDEYIQKYNLEQIIPFVPMGAANLYPVRDGYLYMTPMLTQYYVWYPDSGHRFNMVPIELLEKAIEANNFRDYMTPAAYSYVMRYGYYLYRGNIPVIDIRYDEILGLRSECDFRDNAGYDDFERVIYDLFCECEE